MSPPARFHLVVGRTIYEQPELKAWLFAGSERGGKRAAIMYTLIQTAKLNDVNPPIWLADVLARIIQLPILPPTIALTIAR